MKSLFYLLLMSLFTSCCNNTETSTETLIQDFNNIKADSTASWIIAPQNILAVTVTADNKILVNKKQVNIDSLGSITKEFLLHECDKINKEFPNIGTQGIIQGAINLKNNKNSSYQFFITVYNELHNIYPEIRKAYALQIHQKEMKALSEEEQSVIKQIVPMMIIEATPASFEK